MSNENGDEAMEAQEGMSGAAAGGDAEMAYVSAEEKKPQTTSYVVLAALVLIGPAVLWYLYNRNGPAAAAGSEVESPAATQTVNEFLQTGPNGIRLMREMLHSTEKIVKEFLEYPSMAQIPLADLKTNPFKASAAKVDTESGEKRRREEERQAVLLAAAGLKLQSIIAGNRRACMVNNTMYTEGEQIGQFVVEKISSGSVIVKNGSYRFELKMQK